MAEAARSQLCAHQLRGFGAWPPLTKPGSQLPFGKAGEGRGHGSGAGRVVRAVPAAQRGSGLVAVL